MLAPSAKRLEALGDSHEGWAAIYVLRTACAADLGTLYVLSCIWITPSNDFTCSRSVFRVLPLLSDGDEECWCAIVSPRFVCVHDMCVSMIFICVHTICASMCQRLNNAEPATIDLS